MDAVEKREILPLPGIEPRPSKPSLCQLRYSDYHKGITPKISKVKMCRACNKYEGEEEGIQGSCKKT
jgi:hypothetical protein